MWWYFQDFLAEMLWLDVTGRMAISRPLFFCLSIFFYRLNPSYRFSDRQSVMHFILNKILNHIKEQGLLLIAEWSIIDWQLLLRHHLSAWRRSRPHVRIEGYLCGDVSWSTLLTELYYYSWFWLCLRGAYLLALGPDLALSLLLWRWRLTARIRPEPICERNQ